MVLQLNNIKNLYKKKELRFILFGGLNSIFGYFSSLLIYYSLIDLFGFILCAVMINIVNITFSFITLKLYVFKSRGNWVQEYLRSFITYLNIFILGFVILYTFSELLNFPFYIASFLTILFCAIFSYFLNLKFTFKDI